MRKGSLFAIGIVVLAVTTPLRAADVAIHLRRHGPVAPAAGVSGAVAAQSVADATKTLSFALPAAAVSLPAGDWYLSAHVGGDWSEPRLVSVHDSPLTADLDTFPLARVNARVLLATGKEAHELRAYFHRVSLEDLDLPLEGNVACELAKGVATCELPAGEFDLTFRIPGYVSRYVWSAALPPHGVLDAGTLRFPAGSTFSGRVEVAARRDAPLDRVTVVVRPAAVAGANDEQRHRRESARLTAHPTRKGFFSFDLPAGQFTAQASFSELISEEVNVSVVAGKEVSLRQPLRLEPKRSVTVRVQPPLDPWSKPWTVEFASVDPTGFLLSERALKTSPDGACRFDNVLPGTHRLTIVRAVGQSWASQMLEVDRDTTLDVEVRVIRLTGTVRIGTRPLAALATLRSTGTGASVTFRSKTDGTFAARFPTPEHDTWDEIEITADQPPLKRTLQHVPIQTHDDGTAEMDLDLPARSISGTVVDELGRPVAPALVDVLLPDGVIQQIESPDGAFIVTGLEAGRHRLRAASLERESLDLQDVTLADDKDAMADVVLPIVPIKHLRGVIRSLDGPVLGTALFSTTPGELTRPIILTRVDPEGRFDVRFPGAATDGVLAINAPGFAFRLTRTPLSSDEQTFGVDQNGGTLAVNVPPVRPGLRPYLLHNGAALPALVVAYVAGATFGANLSDRIRFDIASVEPGAYSLCWQSERPPAFTTTPPCISGVVAPHGTLTLAK
jgi:hypothetical protein